MARRPIFIVVPKGTIVLGAYTSGDSADLHARCVEGTGVAAIELLDAVPKEIRDDLYHEWAGDDDTPVVPMDDIDEERTPTAQLRPVPPRKDD